MKKGSKHTEESKKRMSESLKGKSSGMKGKKHNGESKRKISLAAKKYHKNNKHHYLGKKRSEELKTKVSETMKRKEIGFKKGYTPWNKGKKWSNPNSSIRLKELWKNPEFAKKMLKAFKKSPNKPETFLINLFNEYNLPYKFVGNGAFIIAGKCPDFVNINGQKKVIEMFGTYWHKPEEEFERKKIFSQYGFETLVIWENELKDKTKVLERIIKFENRRGFL